MDFRTLTDFRRKIYTCLERTGDALMNVADALSTETPARPLVELSLSPFFERRWPSLWQAFQDGKTALFGGFNAFSRGLNPHDSQNQTGNKSSQQYRDARQRQCG